MEYIFACESCGKVFIKEMSLDMYETFTTHICPECKSTKTKRFYTDFPVVIYKGKGFTKTVKEE